MGLYNNLVGASMQYAGGGGAKAAKLFGCRLLARIFLETGGGLGTLVDFLF